jgi:hypothetical protein
LTATEVARQAISKLGLNGSNWSVVNYAKDVAPSELGTSALQLLTYFKNSSSTYVLAYEIIVPPTLIGGQQKSMLQTERLERLI